MTRQSLVALVALAAGARAAGPSKAVLALREAPARCNVTDEPKRFMVFTRQRSGSRWFVDTISALGDGRRFVEPASHAATAAADLRRFRPSIRIHGLVARLANEHDQNERLSTLLRDRCGDARLHWYEDVVNRPDTWATIMYQLGIWPAPDASRLRGTTLKNTTHVVHGDLPVRSLISNYDKVARALRPTKFRWMLE